MVKKQPEFDPTIDEDALDQEWLGQPKLYFVWAVRLADARLAAEAAKQAADLAKAEVIIHIHKYPEKHQLPPKPTVGHVEAAVTCDVGYTAAINAHLAAQHRVHVLQAAVTALDHRKRALENLVELNVREYFSEPRTKNPQAREAMEDRRARRIHGVRKRPAEDD